MAEDAEAGDIGAGMHAVLAHDRRSGGVERGHRLHGFIDAFRRRFAFFERGGDDAGAEGFGQNQRVADLDADVANDLVRMNDAGDCHAVFDLLVDDAVAADDHRAAFFDLVGAAFEHFAEDRMSILPLGKQTMFRQVLGSPPMA
jgi:hypothetical protein